MNALSISRLFSPASRGYQSPCLGLKWSGRGVLHGRTPHADSSPSGYLVLCERRLFSPRDGTSSAPRASGSHGTSPPDNPKAQRIGPTSAPDASPQAKAASKAPAVPLLVFGRDGRLQISSKPESESGTSSDAVSNAPAPAPAQRAKKLPATKSMSAPEQEVSWKEGAPPRQRRTAKEQQKAPTPPKYSKAARRFYNERFRESERLSKVLATAGVASRRACEDIVFAGRVTVNNAVCTVPQTQVDIARDSIYVDGRSLPKKLPPKLYFALNKPKGYVCSSSADSEKTAISLLGEYMASWRRRNPGIPAPRLFTVGRLDVGTTGLLLITNDGAFAQRVAHPSSGLTKEYVATVGQRVTRRQLALLEQGVEVDGALCTPVLVEVIEEGSSPNSKDGVLKERLRVVVAEGRNREVRRIIEAAGLTVLALKRVRIGSLRLPRDLGLGKFKVLQASEAEKIVSDFKQ